MEFFEEYLQRSVKSMKRTYTATEKLLKGKWTIAYIQVHPSADCVVGWTTLSASRPWPLGRRWQRGLWPLLACREGPGSDHTVYRRVYIPITCWAWYGYAWYGLVWYELWFGCQRKDHVGRSCQPKGQRVMLDGQASCEEALERNFREFWLSRWNVDWWSRCSAFVECYSDSAGLAGMGG